MVNTSSPGRGLPAGNPIANALVVIVGGLIIAVSIVLGFIALVIVGSLIVVLAALFGIRLWWLRRRFARMQSGSESRSRGDGDLIEGDFERLDDAGSNDSRTR